MDVEPDVPPPSTRHDYRSSVPPPPERRLGAGLTIFQSFLLSGCVTILVPVLMVFGFFGLLAYLASESLNQATGALESVYPSSSTNLREKVVRAGDAGAGTIAIVKLHGAIDGQGSPLDGSGLLAQVSEELRNAGDDDAVKAVLLQIDSPGGGLTASDQLHNEVRKLREKGKPVLAWASGLMASGGYYVAVGAEHIMASPTCTVGSIGVIMQHFQIEELMDKLGIKTDPITSGERKDMGSIFRDIKPEEREILQRYVDASHARFVDIVAAGRNLPVEQVRPLADGGIYTAETALAHGLIDRIGYVEDAVAWLEELAGETDMRITSYRRMPGFVDLFREAGAGATEAWLETTGQPRTPRPMALWDGGGRDHQ